MMERIKTLGKRIAVLRAIGSLSQKELSKLCGVNLSTIENIECGRTMLKKEQALQIAKALKSIGISTSADWIINGSPLISSSLGFVNTNVFDNVCSIINSTIKLMISEQNDFIKIGSIVFASAADILKITDEPFVVVKHNENVFACKVKESHKKVLLCEKTNHESTELTDEMSVYFPSIIIMKQE
jgi:transcriptional regulator with XRE-family HTH domain